jgi:hypothetical protein
VTCEEGSVVWAREAKEVRRRRDVRMGAGVREDKRRLVVEGALFIPSHPIDWRDGGKVSIFCREG